MPQQIFFISTNRREAVKIEVIEVVKMFAALLAGESPEAVAPRKGVDVEQQEVGLQGDSSGRTRSLQ
jgi:hypothetical protein